MGESALFATKDEKRPGGGKGNCQNCHTCQKSPELETKDLPLIALMIG
jgi:hypothetical protein